MCYSARIKSNLKDLSWEFRSQLDLDEFISIFTLRLQQPELKVPYGIDRYFLLSNEPGEAKLGKLVREFHAQEKERVRGEIKETEAELKEFQAKKPSATSTKKIGVLERRLEKLNLKLAHSLEQITPLDDRIYPMYFAPVVVEEKGERRMVPMRYRVQNPNGSEVPGQYNVFNARHDSLLQARTWKPLFGKHHLIFPFQRFYEWVARDGKKQEIYFAPEGRAMMWAAGLYQPKSEARSSPKGGGATGSHPDFSSFAMITDDPPKEVAAAGHDRCPIFLSEGAVDAWLEPKKKSTEELLALLRSTEKPFYNHGSAA